MDSFTFLDWLEEERKTVVIFTDSEDPVAEGEEVIGKMTERQKLLFTLQKREVASLKKAKAILATRLALEISEKGEIDTVSFRQSREEKERYRLDALTDVLYQLFWFEIKSHFDFTPMSLGIRKGFLLVKLAQENGQIPTIIQLTHTVYVK